ncbi:precorrin-8X methylmutase [Thiohalospira halophila DSM 15071]|uniref:Precorrin-8X methylmutase n=1 Tax=Thiohalospira halophila DSM 15071 TaxID=1123397 RepID=A0A1I1Q4I5_9GAMM|nr:precorrin-8X methylmutase [Thiohalospira halophila]SFD17041.1 precorrin-8X methylmutase [Thiohalospira halophila DSM 15071]
MTPSDFSIPEYEHDGAAIYRESFATIRAESDLKRFPAALETAVVRMIHGCGMPDIADAVGFSPGVAEAVRSALVGGAPILCDSEMVAHGITRARLAAANRVVCTLRDERVPALAAEIGNTRSAAALELWRSELKGAVVAIGNAPTALFRLLELLAEGAPPPAAIVGIPVGFVGAVESKAALAENPWEIPYLTVHGRRGGSAMAASAVNALAGEPE